MSAKPKAEGRVRTFIQVHKGLWIERIDDSCYIGGTLGGRYEVFPHDKVFIEIFFDRPVKGCLYHKDALPSIVCINGQKFLSADVTNYKYLGTPYFFFSAPGMGSLVRIDAKNCRASGSPGAGEFWVGLADDLYRINNVLSKVRGVDPSIPAVSLRSYGSIDKSEIVRLAENRLIILRAVYVDRGGRSRTVPVVVFSDCEASVKYFVVGNDVERAAVERISPGRRAEIPLNLYINAEQSKVASGEKYVVITWDFEETGNKVCRLYAGLSEKKAYTVASDLSKQPPPVIALLRGARYEVGPKIVVEASVSAKDKCVEGYAEVGLGDASVKPYKTEVKVCPGKDVLIKAELPTGGKADDTRVVIFRFYGKDGKLLYEASWKASVGVAGGKPQYVLNVDINGFSFVIENPTKSALDMYLVFQRSACAPEGAGGWATITFGSADKYYLRQSVNPLSRAEIKRSWSELGIDVRNECHRASMFYETFYRSSSNRYCVRVMRGVVVGNNIVDPVEELARHCFTIEKPKGGGSVVSSANCSGPDLGDFMLAFCGAPSYVSGDPKFTLSSFDQKFSLQILAVGKGKVQTAKTINLVFKPGALLATGGSFTLENLPQVNVRYSERKVSLTLPPGDRTTSSTTVTFSPRDFWPEGLPTGDFKQDEFVIKVHLEGRDKPIGAIWVELKGASSTSSPPTGSQKYFALKPESGRRAVPQGGVFDIELDTNETGEYELGIKMGIGLDAESAKKNAVEVELVNARTKTKAKRHKVKGKIRMGLRLPEKLPREVCIYIEPIINGLPRDGRTYCFI